MATLRQLSLMASTTLLLAAQLPAADAQPYGRGPGMMMGPAMMHGGWGRMCSPAAAGFAEWRIRRLERMIRPTEARRSKFEEFKTASKTAAETMRSACPTEVPATIPDRMEAMEKRMEAMLQAVKTVRPALAAFYATLDDEQKARLDSNSGRRRFWRWRE